MGSKISMFLPVCMLKKDGRRTVTCSRITSIAFCSITFAHKVIVTPPLIGAINSRVMHDRTLARARS